MPETKSPLQSWGIMGPGISLAVIALNTIAGDTIISEESARQVVDQAFGLFGLITGIIGRYRATKQVGFGS